MFQVVVLRWTYVKKFVNLLDWFIYIGSSIVCIPLTSCGMHTVSSEWLTIVHWAILTNNTQPWQWQLGAAVVFVCWLDLLLFFRRMPTLGIYVAMMFEIFKTFMQISVIFIIFTLGFALSFNILFENQVNHLKNYVRQ